MLLLLFACTSQIPSDSGKDSETVPETCTADDTCGDGHICEADACVPGDRNNDLAEAQAIVWDETAEGGIETTGDVDWYSFVAEGGEFIRARTVLDDPEDETYDTVLTLRDEAGKVVATADDYPTGGRVSSADAVIYAYLADAGTYTLAVEDYEAWAGGTGTADQGYTYQVEVEEWDTTTDDPDSESDPGLSIAPDTANSWNAIGVLIDEAGDVDTISFDFPWDDAELILAGASDLGNSAAVPVVELKRDDTRLAYLENIGPAGYLTHPSLEESTYKLVLSDASGEGGTDHWFFLFLNFEESGTAWPEEEEPNDEEDAATTVELTDAETNDGNDYVYGHLWGDGDAADDVDWYLLERPDYDEAHIVLCASAASHGGGTNPELTLFDVSGDEVATSTDYDSPPDARIESTTMDTDLWLRVEGGESEADWYKGIAYIASFSVDSYEDGGYSCP